MLGRCPASPRTPLNAPELGVGATPGRSAGFCRCGRPGRPSCASNRVVHPHRLHHPGGGQGGSCSTSSTGPCESAACIDGIGTSEQSRTSAARSAIDSSGEGREWEARPSRPPYGVHFGRFESLRTGSVTDQLPLAQLGHAEAPQRLHVHENARRPLSARQEAEAAKPIEPTWPVRRTSPPQ